MNRKTPILRHIVPVLLAVVLTLGTMQMPIKAEAAGGSGTRAAVSTNDITVKAAVNDDTWLDNTAYYDTSWYNAGATDYHIATAEQLAGLSKLSYDGNTFKNKNIYIDRDIDLSAHYWVPIRYMSASLFDGQGNAITGLRLNDTKLGKYLTQLDTPLWDGFTSYTGSLAFINEYSSMWWLEDGTEVWDGTTYSTVRNLNFIDASLYSSKSANNAILIGCGAHVKVEGCRIKETELSAGGNPKETRTQSVFNATGFIGKASHEYGQSVMVIEMKDCHTDGMSIYFRDFDVKTSGLAQFSTSMIFGYLAGSPYQKLSANISNCSAKNGGIYFQDIRIGLEDSTGDGNCVSGCIAANEGNGFVNLYGCEADVDFVMNNCVRGSLSYYLGGIGGKVNEVQNSIHKGRFEITNITAKDGGGNIGGVVGKSTGVVTNTANTGDIIVDNLQKTDGNSLLSNMNVGGFCGLLSSNSGTNQPYTIQNCYNLGRVSCETPNAGDRKGGFVGQVSTDISALVFKNSFALNCYKDVGIYGKDIPTTYEPAITLAQIEENGAAKTVIQTGDDNAFIKQGDPAQFAPLKTADTLGENFEIILPHISTFKSTNVDAAKLNYMVNPDMPWTGDLQVKTSGLKGGDTQFSAKMQVKQNKLINGKFQGAVESFEADLTLNLKVVNVDMTNQTRTSAINGETPYELKADLQAYSGGVALDQYDYIWQYSANPQETAPATGAAGDTGAQTLSGLTASDSWTAGGAAGSTSSTRAAPNDKFTKATDPGWYRLKSTQTAADQASKGYGPFNFYSEWVYLSLDDLMLIQSDKSGLLEFSQNSTADELAYFNENKNLSAIIEISPSFKGSMDWQWYKNNAPVDGAAGTLKTADFPTETYKKTLEYTLGENYAESLSGEYELRVTKITYDDTSIGEGGVRDIRSPQVKVKTYAASFGSTEQSGPSYGNTESKLEMTGIRLSSDMYDAENQVLLADAYWIKNGDYGQIAAASNTDTVRHATLTDNGDGTYTATSQFTLLEGMQGDNYQLVIFPLGLTRSADTTPSMRFINSVQDKLALYGITELEYKTKSEDNRYVNTKLTPEVPFMDAAEVTGNNPAGSVTYKMAQGNSKFKVDTDTGAISCLDPSGLTAGQYSLVIEVTESGFKSVDPGTGQETGPLITGDKTTYQKNLTLEIVVSLEYDFSDAVAVNKDLYIYKDGFIFSDSLIDESVVVETEGYNTLGGKALTLKSSDLTKPSAHRVIVVSGNHVGATAINVDQLTLSGSDIPLQIKGGATAEFSLKEGSFSSFSGTTTGLLSEGISTFSGSGTLNLSGPAGASGSGSLSLNGATVNAAGSAGAGIGTKTISIESGKVTAEGGGTGAGIGGVPDGSVTIGGTAMVTARGAGGGAGIGGGNTQLAGEIRINSGNVAAVGSGGSDGIGSGAGANALAHKATIINGGSVTAQGSGANVRNPVNDTAQNGSGKIPLHRVVLKVGETPEAYAGQRVSGSTIWYGDTGTAASPAVSWSAAVSGPDFQVDGASGGLLSMYLPYTAASAVSEDAYYASVSAELPDGSVYRRKVRANADDNLTASLLADMTYQLGIPAEIQAGTPENPVIIGHGVKADFDLSVESNIQEGRTVEVSLSPSKGAMGAWGTFIMNNTAASHNGFTPQYRVQTPGGVQLYTEGPFWTFSGQDEAENGKRVKQGSVLLSGSQTLYAGSYTGNMTWHAVWDDPVVGGE